MSLHQKDWLKIGLGAALLAMTGGLAGVGIPGLFGAGASGAGAAGAGAAGAGASGAAGATGASAAGATGTAATGAGLGHALTSLGAEAGHDAAKTALVTGAMNAVQPRQTAYGPQIQVQQPGNIWSMFPQQ